MTSDWKLLLLLPGGLLLVLGNILSRSTSDPVKVGNENKTGNLIAFLLKATT